VPSPDLDMRPSSLSTAFGISRKNMSDELHVCPLIVENEKRNKRRSRLAAGII